MRFLLLTPTEGPVNLLEIRPTRDYAFKKLTRLSNLLKRLNTALQNVSADFNVAIFFQRCGGSEHFYRLQSFLGSMHVAEVAANEQY